MTATPTAAPPDVELVRSFLNTIDVDDDTDAITTGEELSAWLVEQGLLQPPARASATDLALARSLRDTLRRQLVHHHDDTCDATLERELDDLFARLPLRVTTTGRCALVPVDDGVKGALEELVAACAASQLAGTFERLKICPADDCLWAFYDTSRNRSRRWCSMEVCGNRSKVRSYRERADD
jgi:predicted RNA-binding Zn ribbon-like protein